MKIERKTKVIPPEGFQPSEERQKLFAVYWAEAQTRQRLSSDNFDKAILTYSSSGLALSVAFLKDIVPLKTAQFECILYSSWIFFIVATALTVTSFLASYKAQDISVENAEKYYLQGDDDALNKVTWHTSAIIWSNRLAGLTFVVALIATCFFVGLNLWGRDTYMGKQTIAQDGALTAKMIRVSGGDIQQKGLPTATMPRVPGTQKPAPSQPAPQNTPKTNGN